MLNADYISPTNGDNQPIIGQYYINDFEKDPTTRVTWLQPASFGSNGSGLGQSRPPSVSIQTTWPSDIEYCNIAYVNSGNIST